MMGITSIHNTFAGWFARVAVKTPLTHHSATGRTFDAEELRAFHQSLLTAYRAFANLHPEWTRRGFDESFLRTDAATLLMSCWAPDAAAHRTPSGMDLARMWERKYGMLLCGADRVTQVARLASAANGLLAALAAARRQR